MEKRILSRKRKKGRNRKEEIVGGVSPSARRRLVSAPATAAAAACADPHPSHAQAGAQHPDPPLVPSPTLGKEKESVDRCEHSRDRSNVTTTAAPSLVFKVGDTLRELQRFTDGEVEAYAGVSGDRNPVHLDDIFARQVGRFDRGRVVHGMLVASLFPAVIAAHFPGAVYARQSLKFAAPVYVGDEVLVQVQALHIRASTTKHIVKFGTKCFTSDSDNLLAVDGEALAVLPSLYLRQQLN